MTSMPASRSARAMIFAPRSCPSSPGLATTTRIFRSAIERRILWISAHAERHAHVRLVDRADDPVGAAAAHGLAVAAGALERRLEAHRPAADDDVVQVAARPAPAHARAAVDGDAGRSVLADEPVVAEADGAGGGVRGGHGHRR